jgi:hypothetical protein
MPGFTQGGIREGRPWWVQETPHYVILFDKKARDLLSPEKFAHEAETRLGQIARVLGVRRDKTTKRYPLGDKIVYFVHGSAACTHGNVDIGGIDVPARQRAWFYRHEESHVVLSRVVGRLPSLFNEGFAMFVEQPRSTRNHRIALAALKADVLPPLVQIADSEGFWKAWPTYRTFMYNQAGSFVEYLFHRFGRKAFVSLGGEFSRDGTKGTVLEAFQKAYGTPLRDVELQWQRYLLRRQRQLPLLRRVVRGRLPDSRWVREAIAEIRDKIKTGQDASADHSGDR